MSIHLVIKAARLAASRACLMSYSGINYNLRKTSDFSKHNFHTHPVINNSGKTIQYLKLYQLKVFAFSNIVTKYYM